MTRCLGTGSAGRICIMRHLCRRYLERNPTQPDGRPLSMAMMLCHTTRHEYRIAVPEMETVK